MATCTGQEVWPEPNLWSDHGLSSQGRSTGHGIMGNVEGVHGARAVQTLSVGVPNWYDTPCRNCYPIIVRQWPLMAATTESTLHAVVAILPHAVCVHACWSSPADSLLTAVWCSGSASCTVVQCYSKIIAYYYIFTMQWWLIPTLICHLHRWHSYARTKICTSTCTM